MNNNHRLLVYCIYIYIYAVGVKTKPLQGKGEYVGEGSNSKL